MTRNKTQTLFRDLATLISAGLSPKEAITKLAPSNHKRWTEARQRVSQGKPLATALYQSQLIGRYEKELLDVADHAGRLTEGLALIASDVEKREQRIRRLKSKLYYPIAILLVAIAAHLILQVVNQQRPLLSLLIENGALIFLTLMLSRWLLGALNTDACRVLDKLAPLSNHSWYRLLFQQIVFGSLAWQVQSGIDFKSAFQRTSRLLNNNRIKQQLLTIAQQCGQGASVSQSLATSDLPISPEFKALLHTAEQSGDWTHAINRALKLQREELELRIDTLFDWVPRIYYALAAIIAITVIL
jgi:type II secretory pathway component PulF